MKKYTHLSSKERKQISRYKNLGYSVTDIADFLKRHRSTIYNELNRNAKGQSYNPYKAQHLASARKQKKRQLKLQRDVALRDYVMYHLRRSWSPEQISGRMNRLGRRYYVCHETIYQYIYRSNNKQLFYLLKNKKPKRGKRFGRKKGSGKFASIRPLCKRSEEVELRDSIGHWEADTIRFNTDHNVNITTLVERKARYVILIKNIDRKSATVMGQIKKVVKLLPKKLGKTMTFDQGSEFADFKQFEQETKCLTYYCEPRSPWQRGTNENTNGRIRQYLPRNTSKEAITQEYLDNLSKKLNNTPRKCLGYLTPKEALLKDCKSFCRTSK